MVGALTAPFFGRILHFRDVQIPWKVVHCVFPRKRSIVFKTAVKLVTQDSPIVSDLRITPVAWGAPSSNLNKRCVVLVKTEGREGSCESEEALIGQSRSPPEWRLTQDSLFMWVLRMCIKV